MGIDPRETAMQLAKGPAETAAAEKMLEAGKQFEQCDPCSMYQVNINADPAHFLDWESP